jgi:putative transposase
MPRRARLRAAGIALHVIQRGNNRSACFYTADDYAYYLEHLDRFARRFRCAIHAYVLMTNHVHLLLTPEEADGASMLMKYLGQYYVHHVNQRYGRTGTLWEGRFKSCLAQSQTYVLACYRYIELNPVRAGMVAHPGKYRWSSYTANAVGASLETLTPHSEYLALGASAASRHEAYRALVAEGLDPKMTCAIRESTNGNVALGTTRFQVEIETMLQRRARRGVPGRPRVGDTKQAGGTRVGSKNAKNVVCP